MARIDLRKQESAKQPVEPEIKGITIPGVQGTLPLNPQAYVIPTKLTPAEQKALLPAGYKPGDPVPIPSQSLTPEAKRFVDAVKKDREENMLPPAPLSTEPLKPPKVVNAEDLPKDVQKALADQIELGRKQLDELRKLEAQGLPGASQSINEAITGKGVVVLDDRKEQAQKPNEELGGDLDKPILCPHCGWPQDVPDPVIVEPADKRAFRLSLRGAPFQKEFSILGGAMKIRIRSLTPKEVDVCHAQCWKELSSERLLLQDRRERLLRFRVALQLCRLEDPESGMLIELPESINDWEVDETETDTKIPAIIDYVYTNVLTSENLHRVVAHCVAMLNSMCSRMEANVHNPDFWKEIG